MHGYYETRDEKRCGGRHRHRHFRDHGHGGRHGHAGSGGMGHDDMRVGRMLAQGDLRLIALAFIAEAPRHGYEIIKMVEERTADWYSPSPGIVYPTLTYLEEAGYVTAATEGSKRLYTITEEGTASLTANRDIVDAVLARLTALGDRVRRKTARNEQDNSRPIPALIEASLAHLRATVGKRLENDPETEAQLVEIIARATTELQRRN